MNNTVVWIFGQPGSGKTTFGKEFVKQKYAEGDHSWINIDADVLRMSMANNGYDRLGRMNNILAAVQITRFLNLSGYNVVSSFVTPYAEMRNIIFRSLVRVMFVYLQSSEVRGREDKFVNDFEYPDNDASIARLVKFDTATLTTTEMYNYIIKLPFFASYGNERQN